MRLNYVFLGLLLVSRYVCADENALPNISEEDYLGDVPRVLTVSRLAQTLADAPSAVTVIDREMIRASGAVDIPELFRLVPGMYVGANAGYVYNTNHAVSYHGMNTAYPGQMQVLINGRSVYTPIFGGVKWSELPVAMMDIDRIEVTRGPNAASYGANAFFATINIITQSPNQAPANTALATHGEGRNEAFYRHAGRTGDLAYRATFGYRQDDGWQNRNDFKRTRFINAQADYQLNPSNSFEIEMGAALGSRGEGNINEDRLVFLPRTRDMSNYHLLARWRHQLSDTSDFQLQAYYSSDKSDDETTSVDLRPVLRQAAFDSEFTRRTKLGQPAPLATLFANAVANQVAASIINNVLYINNDIETTRSDIEAQHTFAVGSSIRAVWGASMRRDTAYAPHYFGNTKTDYFDLQRVFGHVEWRPHAMWTLNAGTMIEHNDFTGTDTSPRASVNFKPSANHAFRLGVSSALRTPNYIEEKFNQKLAVRTTLPAPFPNVLLFQTLADTGNVRPEQIVSREFGYMGKWGKLQLDTRVFSDTISDVIRFDDRTDFTVPSNVLLINKGDVETGLNSGNAKVEGIDLQMNWPLANKTHLWLAHSHVSIRETRPDLKRNFVKSSPSNSLTAMVTHRFNQHWDGSFIYYQTGRTTQLGDGDPVSLIRRSDIRLARKFKAQSLSGEFSGVIENLFNDHYMEFADYNVADRRARFNLRLDF